MFVQHVLFLLILSSLRLCSMRLNAILATVLVILNIRYIFFSDDLQVFEKFEGELVCVECVQLDETSVLSTEVEISNMEIYLFQMIYGCYGELRGSLFLKTFTSHCC